MRMINAVDASCADKATDCASKIQNGTHCAGAFAAQCRKSCRLCWTAGSAKLAFAHTPGGKSPFLGGARKLANGNYLGNFGALTQPVCDSPCQRDFTATCLHARTCEVLPNGTEVWYARIGGKIGVGDVMTASPAELARVLTHHCAYLSGDIDEFGK